MNIQEQLASMHSYLMHKQFPRLSVSVIHRHQDLGFHIIFGSSVKEMVTDEIKDRIKSSGFTYSINK